MLVLGRKPSEKICIGDEIVVTVVRVGNNCVRLGIEAPQGVNIRRGELPAEPPAETARQEHELGSGAV